MKKINYRKKRPFLIASIASLIYFGVGHFILLPDIMKGFLLGIVVVGYLLTLSGRYYDNSKLIGWKKRIFRL